MSVTVTAPGVYDMPADVYHADPVPGGSLSSTGARKLIPPSCPAKYQHWLTHRGQDRRELDIGKVAHSELLGVGDPVHVVDADSWRSKAAQDERAAARRAGAVPVLAHEHEQIQAMTAAVRRDLLAGPLFDLTVGGTEQALFWLDDEFGVWRRALLDRHLRLPDGRLLIVDYKTTKNAEPDAIERSIAEYGYHLQDAWYCDAATAVGLAGGKPPAFLFVFQEKTEPYVVTVVELDAPSREWGQLDARRALITYARCQRTGHWPGYSDDVLSVELPVWSVRTREAAHRRGAYRREDTTP